MAKIRIEGLEIDMDMALWKDKDMKIYDGSSERELGTREGYFEAFLKELGFQRLRDNFSSVTFDYNPNLRGDGGRTVFESSKECKIKTTDTSGAEIKEPIHLLVKATITNNTNPSGKESKGLRSIFRKEPKPKPDLLFECNTLPFLARTLDCFRWHEANIDPFITKK